MPRPPARTRAAAAPVAPTARVATAVALHLALSLAAPPAARASAPELFSFGTRSPSMAGTGAAFADDFEAVYANPAGLAEAPRRRLTLGYVAGAYHLTLDGAGHDNGNTTALLLGAELPLPLGGVLRDRLSIGLGFHLPTNVVNRARDPFPDVPTLLLDNRTQTVSVMAALSARLPGRVSIGGGVIALAALLGGIDLVGMAGGHFGARSEEQLVASYAPLVGVRWQARPALRLGLVYRGESMSRYDLAVRNQLGGALPFDLPTLRFAGISQYDPHTVALEVAWGQPRAAGLLLAAQLQWQHWSAMPPLVLAVTPASPSPPDPALRDTATARLGLEYVVDDGLDGGGGGGLRTSLRAGYAFALSPVPDASAPRTLHDAHRHVASVGVEVASRSRRAPLRGQVFYQLNVLQGGERAGGWFGVFGFTVGADL